MSTDEPAPPRRSFGRWAAMLAGPVVVSAMLIAAVAYPFVHKADASAEGPCRRRPETVAAIRADPVLTQHPKSGKLGTPSESYSCGSSPDDSVISFISNGVISRRLTTSMSDTAVRAFYADLAERSGWRPDQTGAGLYAATKPDGACPWWFVLTRDKRGFGLQVYYQPIGVRPDDCEWLTGSPMLIPFAD